VPDVEPLVRFYETLERASLAQMRSLYAPDARFKDPFNEVTGVEAILGIFEHMFEQVDAPRFRVIDRVVAADAAVLIWEFRFGIGRDGGARMCVRGASHLRYDALGRVVEHRDYWDPAEELYAKLPWIGPVVRALQRRLRAPG
jgi:ketosteroid isomerase-like protein